MGNENGLNNGGSQYQYEVNRIEGDYSYGGDVYDYAFYAMALAYELNGLLARDQMDEIKSRNKQIEYYRKLKSEYREDLNALYALKSGSSGHSIVDVVEDPDDHEPEGANLSVDYSDPQVGEPTPEEYAQMSEGVWYYYTDPRTDKTYRVSKAKYTDDLREVVTDALGSIIGVDGVKLVDNDDWYFVRQERNEIGPGVEQEGSYAEDRTEVRHEQGEWKALNEGEEDGDIYSRTDQKWYDDDDRDIRRVRWNPETDTLEFKSYNQTSWVTYAISPAIGLLADLQNGASQSKQIGDGTNNPFAVYFTDNDSIGVESYDGRHPANERWIEWPPGSGNEIPVSYGIEVVKNHMEDIDDKISDLTSINQIAMIRLQQYINNMNMLVTLLSNLLSNKKDAENTIVRNI